MTHRSRLFPVGIAAAALAAAALAGFAALPVRAQSSFPDVPADHWAAEAVRRLKEAGIVIGYPAAAAQRPQAGTGYAGDRPVTRYELAVALWRFVQYIERADQQKKGMTGASSGAGSGRDAVRRLVSGGYLPASTPLAINGGRSVSAKQFADALSQVIVKVAERKTPVTPDSRRAPIERPGQAPGTGTQK